MRHPLQKWPGIALALALLMASCAQPVAIDDAAASPTIPAGTRLAAELVRGARPQAGAGECWAEELTPAVIETVTDQVEVAPARTATDGKPAQPATYRSQVQQRILSERSDVWFQVPCPEQIGPEVVASLQRALKVRGLHRGPVTGMLDPATATAIRRYQAPQGLDSTKLSLAAARQLGLVAFDRDDLQ